MVKKNIASILTAVFVAVFTLFSSVTASAATYYSPEVTSSVYSGNIIENVNDPNLQIVADPGSTLTIVGTNTVGSIQCEGNLSIVGDKNSSLTVVNNQYESPYMTGYPGIVAKGTITLSNLSFTDASNGTAIADVSGSSGSINISNCNVNIENSSGRLYGIRSIEGISITDSNLNINTSYTEAGLFAFKDIVVNNSTVSINQSGKYTAASVSGIKLGRNQKVDSAKIGIVNDTLMFPNGKEISTVVNNGAYACGRLDIGISTVSYSVNVVGGSAQYPDGYEGEEIIVTADEVEGKRFVKWVSSDPVTFYQSNAFSTSFEMPAQDVTIEAIFEDIESVPETTTSSAIKINPEVDSITLDPVTPNYSNQSSNAVTASASGSTGSAGGAGGGGAATPVANASNVSSTDDSITETTVNNDGTRLEVTLTDETIVTIVKDADGNISSSLTYAISEDDDSVILSGFETTGSTLTIPSKITVDGDEFPVTRISPAAFKGNTSIKVLTIGKNVTEIGKSAFSNCRNLKTVYIEGKLSSVGKNAFKSINKRAVIKIKANFKTFRTEKKMIKKANAPSTVKYKRVK